MLNENLTLPKIGKAPSLLLLVMAIIFVFVSQDPNIADQTLQTVLLQNLFFHNFIHPHFSIFQFLFILLIFYIFRQGRVTLANSTFVERTIVFATGINIIFLMVNPNNDTENPILGMPLLSDPSIYVSLLLMFALFLNRNKLLIVAILKKLFIYILWIAALRALMLLILFFIGFGNITFFGVTSTLMEEDTLILFVLTSGIFLVLYFIRKKKIYLVVWFIFLFVQLLSFRRSGTLSFFLVNLTILIVHYFYGFNARKKTIVFFVLPLLVFGFITIVGSYDSLPKKYQMYVSRYVGAFVDLPSNYEYASESRNEHLIQSNESVFYAIENLPFWGFGYGRSESRSRYNYKGNTGIHNAFYNLWEQFGLFYLFYTLIFIFIFISEALKTFKYRRKYPYDYLLIRTSVLAFVLIFWINSWVLMIHNIIGFKMVVIRLFLLSFLFYVTPSNYYLIKHKFRRFKIKL